ncbi:MAG: AI-2E family transporter [Clostridiales Family XIII bacterium]|jgi:predicted PurR-regulated permease PerM|nr:AI-2E family transporter [Clostridiales Family XIII bacterium]
MLLKKNHQKIVSLIVIGSFLVFIFAIKDIRSISLLTFLISFIFFNLQKKSKKICKKILPINIHENIILIILYLLGLFVLTCLAIYLVPIIIKSLFLISSNFRYFNIDTLTRNFDPRIAGIINNIDWNSYLSKLAEFITSLAIEMSRIGINIFFAFIISFLFLFEKKKLYRLAYAARDSKIGFIYNDFFFFSKTFTKAFTDVMKVQLIVASVNAIISCIVLLMLGFPEVFGLTIMIFALGLIPVAGVIISIIPLSIIGFNTGGISLVLAVIIMIIIIHAIEAYILNPKIMSHKVQLPVCIVFLTLIFSEQIIGVWGLLIGVPIVVFLLKIFSVDYAKK